MSSPPVVLVHGYLATASQLIPMRRYLQRRGLRVHLVRLSPFCIQDVRKLGSQLTENIDQVCQQEGVSQVDIVGVSLGGLLAIRYAQTAPQGRIRRLVTIGTPFRGTWVATLGLPILGGISRGIWQTLPTSQIVKEIQDRGVPPGVELTSISMRGDLLCAPDRCQIDGATHVVLSGLSTPLTHQWLVLSRSAFEVAARALIRVDAAVA